MADYKEGDVTWQGFLRPYRDAKEAKAVFEKYVEGVKKDGAEIKTIAAEGADEMVVSSNIGLFDVVFRKGNTLAGANGATDRRAGRGLRPRAGQEPAGQRPDRSGSEQTSAQSPSDASRAACNSTRAHGDGIPR